MQPIIDPRAGDIEDDAASTKSRKLSAIAGSMLVEISLPKLITAWVLLIAIPGLLLGLAPLVAWAWLAQVRDKLAAISGIGSLLIVAVLLVVGLYGVRRVWRFVERSFWSLHALAVQPVYALCREGLSQFAESFLPPEAHERDRSRRRAAMAAAAGILACGLAAGIVALAWPHTRWSASWAMLAAPATLIVPALANAVVISGIYLLVASIVWGFTDAVMDQPERMHRFHPDRTGSRRWRIAHLSDIHTVGERFGFRIESGRSGPQGNERLDAVLARLAGIHAAAPLDQILITGDMTDAGRASEWAEFLDRLSRYPQLASIALVLPGNHDLNIADRANPARLELPTSARKQVRQMRTLSAMEVIQGGRAYVCDRATGQIGPVLTETLRPVRAAIETLADAPRLNRSAELARVWADVFPMVVPPPEPDGLGIILINSNADTNFSFTNALGLVAADDISIACKVMDTYPESAWILALHHHVMEYPMPVKAFSERIGTALINGSWLVRRLRRYAGRIAVMHGHRHIDWIGRIGELTVVSAPSPVMEARDDQETAFYVHTVMVGAGGRLELGEPERVFVTGRDHAAPSAAA
jgi:hypothetical protein